MRPAAFATALAAVMLPAVSSAQNNLSLAVGAGVSVPTGDLADGAGVGPHGQISVGLNWIMLPMGFRLDGAYHLFPGKSGGPDVTAIPVIINLTYRFPSAGSALAPYVILGAGASRSDCKPSCGSRTGFAWNAGIGTHFYLLRVRMRLEGRYQQAGGRLSYFPVTVGFSL